MADKYSVSLEKIIHNHSLEAVYLPKPASDIEIITNEINRPGIVLTGYTDYFDNLRIQILKMFFGFVDENLQILADIHG